MSTQQHPALPRGAFISPRTWEPWGLELRPNTCVSVAQRSWRIKSESLGDCFYSSQRLREIPRWQCSTNPVFSHEVTLLVERPSPPRLRGCWDGACTGLGCTRLHGDPHGVGLMNRYDTGRWRLWLPLSGQCPHQDVVNTSDSGPLTPGDRAEEKRCHVTSGWGHWKDAAPAWLGAVSHPAELGSSSPGTRCAAGGIHREAQRFPSPWPRPRTPGQRRANLQPPGQVLVPGLWPLGAQ